MCRKTKGSQQEVGIFMGLFSLSCVGLTYFFSSLFGSIKLFATLEFELDRIPLASHDSWNRLNANDLI